MAKPKHPLYPNAGVFRITLDVVVDLDSWEMNYGTGETAEQVADQVASWTAELLTDQLAKSTVDARVTLR